MTSFSNTLPVLLCALALSVEGCSRPPEAEKPGELTFYSRAVRDAKLSAEADPAIQKRLDRILAEARSILALPLVRRAGSLAELRSARDNRIGSIDSRTDVVSQTDPAKAEIFALSMADTNTAGLVARELPLLAAAYEITGDKAFLDRVVSQLREVVSWQPLQRPGWTLYTAKNSLPAGGRDGVWLSTGLGIAAIVQTLQVLPEGALPPDLVAALRRQLATEMDQSVQDWKDRLPWFVRSDKVVTNQWVVPSSGIVLAAAYLGRGEHAEAYDLGMKNLEATVQAFGTDGSSSEGAIYAAHWTAPFLFLASRAAQDAGDDRLAQSPFLRNFPNWLAGAFQPGGYVVNCFDGYTALRGTQPLLLPDITLLTVLSQSPALIWLLQNEFGPSMSPLDLYGIMALSLDATSAQPPPLYGAYERAAWVVWRSNWQPDASGVWIRGGHRTDFHDHNDRGHVNFIVNGKAVLIEAGTPTYSLPEKEAEFNSVRGHNVLQVGDEILPRKQPAPVTVHRLDAQGGDITVEAGAGYLNGSSKWVDGAGETPRGPLNPVRWTRRVTWDSQRMEVTDQVILPQAERVTFRWHLGSEQPLEIAAGANALSLHATLPAGVMKFPGWISRENQPLVEGVNWQAPEKDIVNTPSAAFAITADQPVEARQEMGLDHAFKFRLWKHQHTTLVVQSREKVQAITIKTVITAQ